MKLVASVSDGGKIMIIESDCYDTKKKFWEDLRGNGFSVRFISYEGKFEEDCEKFYEQRERASTINKLVQAGRRQGGKAMGMTMKEYMKWLKG